MEGKRVIHIVSFLYYIQDKAWEGSENKEESMDFPSELYALPGRIC